MFALFATVFPACGGREAPAVSPLVAQVAGTLTVDGLQAPVRVVRDRWGVPHIYAASQHDLFVAQGLVQAQDRLFQMDLWRRAGQGRLSEVLGPNFIERDAMTRRIQYTGDLDVEWARYGPEARAIAGAFVRGVNAWVALAREHPPEAFVLAGWLPDPWAPDDLLNRTDAVVENAGVLEDIARAGFGDVVADAVRRAGAPPFFTGLAAPVSPPGSLPAADRELAAPAATASVGGAFARATGARLDFADSSTRFAVPSTRYLVHLIGGGLDVIGITSPWRPGVAAGHNDRVAWAFAPSVGIRTHIVRAIPDSAPVTTTVARSIIVKGRDEPFRFDTEVTADGIVIATDRAAHRRFVFSWTGFDAGAAPEMMSLRIDRAANRRDVESAARGWSLPARSFVVLDAGGPPVSGQDEVRSQGGGPRIENGPTRALFTHPLGVTEQARRRFNVGPLPRPVHDQPVQLSIDVRSWDESRAMNAPGQSESPTSPHFSDLAGLWSGGTLSPLVYGEAAVQANTEATLMLLPSNRKASP